jgi:hypothetical protein
LAHDNGRILVRAEHDYPKGSPNTKTVKEEIRRYSSQYSARISALPKRPSSKPHGATRQQAIVKTPAKLSAYQIPGVIADFVILVFKV